MLLWRGQIAQGKGKKWSEKSQSTQLSPYRGDSVYATLKVRHFASRLGYAVS